MVTNLEEIARNYKEKIIKGWENLYCEKRKRLYTILSKFYVGEDALELGCGDGESTQYIVASFKSVDVVDGSLQHLLDVNKRFPTINIIHSYFEYFNPVKQYDTIFMTHILEHLDSPEELLIKCYRWLRDHGVVLISVPNALSFHRLVGVKMGLLETPYSLNEQDILTGHKRVYDKRLMDELISKTPFHVKYFTGLMLKPLSNRQIEATWTKEMIDAFFELGFDFPEHCAELVYVLEKKPEVS